MSEELPWFRIAVGRRRVLDLPLIGWLTVVWILLWGTVSWANLLSGVLVAAALCLAFPVPPVDLGLRLHPWGLVRVLAYLTWDMWASAVRVSRQTFRRGPLRAAVVAVPLRCRGDLMLAAVAVAVSNIPGGALVEVQRATATLFVHLVDADDPAAVAAAKRSVWRTEALVVRALGTRAERARVAQPPPGGEGEE